MPDHISKVINKNFFINFFHAKYSNKITFEITIPIFAIIINLWITILGYKQNEVNKNDYKICKRRK